MPGIENSDSGSGRVTRSLRKRLTSVDIDSSRPGTPVLSSLQSVQETVTPSKRTTRRTSMSTPVPTPSKGKGRLDVPEAVNSPARRSTRRRSLSTHEQEESIIQTKSKEPAFDVVKEEEITEKSPENKSKTGTRISPRLVSRPRSETPNIETAHKSPEVSPQVLKHMKHSKIMLKKEHIEEAVSKSTAGTSVNKQQELKQASPQKTTIIEFQKEKTPKATDKQKSPEKQHTPNKASEITIKSDDAKVGATSETHNTPAKKAVEESPKGNTLTENETTLSATETSQHSPKKKRGRPQKLKNVGFNNTDDEEGEKSVFPKTPGLTKSKSYILDTSKPDEGQSINKSECKLDDSHEETENDEIKDVMEDDNEIMNTKTPYKLKLNSVESSTPIQSTSAKKKDKEDLTQKDTSDKDCVEPKEGFSFPKSWSHSVSGTVNDLAKIDRIESEEKAKKKLEEEKAIKKNASILKSTKQKRVLHDDDSDEDDLEEDDLLMDDEEEEREREKSMFVDDEAMEVAEGEESMDSEERNYLEENEIPVYAESIGSEDTVEEECEEEADEEDAAFVVSDTEEILHEESDSDDVKKGSKKYKRILRNVDSSDEESNSEKEKDDDICLIVDSSVEENTSVKGKFDKTANEEALNDSRKMIKQEAEVSADSIESQRDRKSLKDKKDVIDVAEDGENTTKSLIDENNDHEQAKIGEASDEKLSEKKSNSVDPEKQNSAEKHVEEDTSENSACKSEGNNEEKTEDTETEQTEKLSKKERKSLLSLTNRKSLATTEEKDAYIIEDKSMISSPRRKSLKKQESVTVEEDRCSIMNSGDDVALIEEPTTKELKKERKSLNKSEISENKSSPFKMKSLQTREKETEKESTDTDMETADRVIEMSEEVQGTPSKLSKRERKSLKSQVDENSHLKRKSLQVEERNATKEDSSIQMTTEEEKTDSKTENEELTLKLSKKERKSLKSQADENSNLRRKSLEIEGRQATGDDNSVQVTVEEENTDSKTENEEPTLKLSKKERKSLKSQADENSNLRRKSLEVEGKQTTGDDDSVQLTTEEEKTDSKTENEELTLKLSKKERMSVKSQTNENKNSSLSPFNRSSLQTQKLMKMIDTSASEMETEDKDTETNTDYDESTLRSSQKEKKSLKSKADENKSSLVRSPFKRKSFQLQESASSSEMETEDKDTETNTDIESLTWKSSRNERNSLNKSKAGDSMNSPICSPAKRKSLKTHEKNRMEEDQSTESSAIIETSESKSPKKKRASLNKSQADENQNSFIGSPLRKISVATKEENREVIVKSKLETPNKSIQERTATPSKSDIQSSGRKLSKKERKSLMDQELVALNTVETETIDDNKLTENEKAEKKTPTKESLKKNRMSLNKTAAENKSEEESDDDNGCKSSDVKSTEEAKLSLNASLENESDSGKQHDDKSKNNSSLENNHDSTPKSPKGMKKSPLKQLHKSWSRSSRTANDSDEVSEQSDDSCNSNDHTEDGENKLLDALKHSLNSLKNKKKSLNDSQHKLDRSKLERSVLFVDDDASDEAETTSAFESSRVSEEKSRNSSKISRKSFNKSIFSPRTSEKTASPKKITKIDSDSNADCSKNENEIVQNAESDGEGNEENVSDMSKVMEFLGEEEGGHNSPPNLNSTRRKSLNKSKLDETFHLESNNNSVLSILHRSVLKKSLNQGKILSESLKRSHEKCDDEDDSGDVTDAEFSAEEEIEVVKKVLPDKGLSVSLSGIEKKKKSKDAGEQIHKSFTIGVSLRNTSQNDSQENNTSPPESPEPSSNDSLSEKDDLEKIENVQVAGPYKPRNSLSKIDANDANEISSKSKSKRFSMYVSGESASQSFVENLAEEKKKLHSKRSRKSNSFCGVSAPTEEPEEAQPQPKQPEANKSQTQSSETLKSDTKTDIQRILSRCDEILEAANQAKREAKLNAKKTKVKKPKWMDNEEKKTEEEELKIPLVSKKELKRKEKMKKELAKAIKHSTAMLKTIDPKLVKEIKTTEVKSEKEVAEEQQISSKRLPADFLDELEAPKPKKKKTKEIETTPPSDENSKRTSNKGQSRAVGTHETEKKKKKQSREVFETASGTVIVEPATPSKLKFQNGFRESPKTPVGFKIQDVDEDREKVKKRAKKLFAASGTFEEEDTLNLKTIKKSKKRKFQIEEPVFALPKTQWTSSGMFIEEDVQPIHHPLANSTATQFMVSSLGGNKKSKSKPVSSATLSTALNFKKNALFSDKVKREPARNLVYRKERALVNNRY